jgi:hypothetical protein
MHKSATKCNKTIGKWYKNKHGASKIIDTFGTYQVPTGQLLGYLISERGIEGNPEKIQAIISMQPPKTL